MHPIPLVFVALFCNTRKLYMLPWCTKKDSPVHLEVLQIKRTSLVESPKVRLGSWGQYWARAGFGSGLDISTLKSCESPKFSMCQSPIFLWECMVGVGVYRTRKKSFQIILPSHAIIASLHLFVVVSARNKVITRTRTHRLLGYIYVGRKP